MNAITTFKEKIINLTDLAVKVEEWKQENLKIVFTNGCFDLLHAGHIAYLAEAATLGDKLIIGLNTDSSVKKLKGPDRPVNDETTRTSVLAAMSFIDAVVLFDEPTPIKLIKVARPDILVKGGDYNVDSIVGAKETIANGGHVNVLTFLPGYSSSSIIEKIRKH